MRISRSGRITILLVVILLLGACASGTTETTAEATATTEEAVATTAATEETSDPGNVSSLGDVPAECLDSFRTYLRAIEPIVADFDFESATVEEFEAFSAEVEGASGTFEEETSSCPDLDLTTEEGFAAIIEFVEDEAPGAVAYFEFLQGLGNAPTGVTGSGDCESNIAAVQEYVDRGGTTDDLTVAELSALGTLIGAVTSTCSIDRAQEYFQQEDVAAFMTPG